MCIVSLGASRGQGLSLGPVHAPIPGTAHSHVHRAWASPWPILRGLLSSAQRRADQRQHPKGMHSTARNVHGPRRAYPSGAMLSATSLGHASVSKRNLSLGGNALVQPPRHASRASAQGQCSHATSLAMHQAHTNCPVPHHWAFGTINKRLLHRVHQICTYACSCTTKIVSVRGCQMHMISSVAAIRDSCRCENVVHELSARLGSPPRPCPCHAPTASWCSVHTRPSL